MVKDGEEGGGRKKVIGGWAGFTLSDRESHSRVLQKDMTQFCIYFKKITLILVL